MIGIIIDLKKIYWDLQKEISDFWEYEEFADYERKDYIEIGRKRHLLNEIRKLIIEYGGD